MLTIVLITIVVLIVLGLAGLFVLYFWLDWKVFDFVMDAGRGKGPLEVRASDSGTTNITLTIINHGKNRIRLNAVEGTDVSGRRVFPVPIVSPDGPQDPASRMKQFASLSLKSGETTSVMLDLAELQAMNCQTLGIRAGKRGLWPADGFAPLASVARE